MFSVNGNTITITAGDTGLLTVGAGAGGVTPGGNDRAVFTVRDRTGGREVMKKTMTPDANGRVQIPFANADTERLRAGAYVWDIRYALDAVLDSKGNVTGGREIITPLPPSPFVVMEAVGDV